MAFKHVKTKIRTVVYTKKIYQLTDKLFITYNYAHGVLANTQFDFYPTILKGVIPLLNPFYANEEFCIDVLFKGVNPYTRSGGYYKSVGWQSDVPDDVNEIDINRIFLSCDSEQLLFNLDEETIPTNINNNMNKQQLLIDESIDFLLINGKIITNDYAIEEAKDLRYEQLVSERLESGDPEYIKHQCSECATWYPSEHRCSCGNRRMTYDSDGTSFKDLYIFPASY